MKVSFEGVGEQVLSFGKAEGVKKGSLVKIGANAVKADSTGREYLVIKVDTAAARVGFII